MQPVFHHFPSASHVLVNRATMNLTCSETILLNGHSLNLRYEVRESDLISVREIVASTGFFHPPEVDVAVELVEERLRRGDASGYHFAFLEQHDHPIAYACFGPIACTASSFDVYWIAVHRNHQSKGIGRWLMSLTEDLIRTHSGQRIYVETSGRPDYLPTRTFYDRCGYIPAAELPEFYGPGDSKVIYLKVLQGN